MLIGQMLSETRKKAPGTLALWFNERSWTYAELDDATDRIAAALLAAGVQAGDRVALFLPNCPELILGYFACFKIGAITVPLNYRYRQAEARYAIEHSGSTTLMVHQGLAAEVESLPLRALGVARSYLAGAEVPWPGFVPFYDLLAGPPSTLPAPAFGEQQLAVILYTSGTTAKPKGVMYSHSTLWQNCAIQSTTFEFTSADVHLISTAACHAAAFTGQLLPNVYVGGTIVLTHLPSPEHVVRAMERHRVTRGQMLPAPLEDLAEYLEHHPEADLGSWRSCTAGGDAVPLDLHRRFRQVAGFDLTELCGMTEALSYVTNPPFGEKRLGSIGKPVARTRLRLVDEQGGEAAVGQIGEILVQTPAMMIGYWNDPAATAAALRDGWLYTGDLGRRDKDGFYWFVGRKKEIIIRGGSNISPLEIEEAIDAHPSVHLSCVVGFPDKHFGQIVAAFVVLRDDVSSRPTVDELRRFVADRIAAYKVPERITFVDELPLNPTGKVDRKALQAHVRQ
ncbi:MAG: class I adenylate-forming enzyme family protein [Beijerinckiaceae bacterium]